jgi:hypothetical protein
VRTISKFPIIRVVKDLQLAPMKLCLNVRLPSTQGVVAIVRVAASRDMFYYCGHGITTDLR